MTNLCNICSKKFYMHNFQVHNLPWKIIRTVQFAYMKQWLYEIQHPNKIFLLFDQNWFTLLNNLLTFKKFFTHKLLFIIGFGIEIFLIIISINTKAWIPGPGHSSPGSGIGRGIEFSRSESQFLVQILICLTVVIHDELCAVEWCAGGTLTAEFAGFGVGRSWGRTGAGRGGGG